MLRHTVSMFSKHRLEALSDGIFAIVMTLLVLDLKVPDGPFPPHFALHLAQQALSFLITFMLACIFWTLQHKMFALVEDIHQKTLIVTFVFLGLISVLPFSTALLGHHIDQHYAFTVYYAHSFLIALALTIKLYMLLHIQKPADTISADLLKLRLQTMTIVLAALLIVSGFLPIQWMGITAAIAGACARLFTKKRKAELEAMRAAASPAV